MSFRFRRTMKIAPGLRVNFGKRGASLTAGGKLGRVTFGSSGTTLGTSIPGSGIYFSEKVGSKKKSSSYNEVIGQQVSVGKADELREIINTGAIISNPETGRKYSDIQLNTMLKRLERQEEYESNFSEIEAEERTYNDKINICKNVLSIPGQGYWKNQLDEQVYKKTNFKKPEPVKNYIEDYIRTSIFEENPLPTFDFFIIPSIILFTLSYVYYMKELSTYSILFGISASISSIVFIIRVIKIRNKVKLDLEQEISNKLEKEYFNKKEEWLKEKTIHIDSEKQNEIDHFQNEEIRVTEIKDLLNGKVETIQKVLEDELGNIDVPFETEIAIETIDSNRVFLDVDLPEIEDCITTTIKSVLKSGKLKEKNKPIKLQKEEYAKLVTGFAFYLCSYIFNSSPTINEVIISGYTQRINKATGNVEDLYVYSIKIDKENFKNINFEFADTIQAFYSFDLKWNLSKSFDLKKIDPFELNDIIEK